MPLNFLRRKKPQPSPSGPGRGPTGGARAGLAFEGLTEEWRLVGQMHIEGRLSDALNKREAIAIDDVLWAPIDGSKPFAPAPGLQSIDPYDLIIVLAGDKSLPEMTDEERSAHKVHKVTYDVALETPPFRVIGTVHLNPGTEPDRLLDRATEMFVPVVEAIAFLGELRVSAAEVETILVNRVYLRGVDQIDKRTGSRAQKLPGAPLGGITWQDRS